MTPATGGTADPTAVEPTADTRDEAAELRARVQRLERRVARERAAREEAERIAEAGTRRLLEVNAELDERVARRTRELAEANREAHEASQAKTRLLAAVSHEVFTPVHQAAGSLELAATAMTDGWGASQLDRARDALSTIERLFRNLIVVAEADGRGLGVTPGPTDVGALVADLVAHWRPRVTQQGSLLVVAGEALDGVMANTDALRLRHALDELLHNATRFTVGGIVRVATAVAVEVVTVTVVDEGPGLPAALAHRLFEPFAGEQGQPGAGLGLGLAAAARIAASLGGELTRTEQPVGESFTLSFAR